MTTPISLKSFRTTGLATLALAAIAILAGTSAAWADKIFVGNDWGSEIWMFDSETGASSRALFCNDTDGANGLNCDAQGNLYESDFGTRSIVKFNPDGQRTTFAQMDSPPGGAAFDDIGNLIVPFQWGHKIVRVSADGSQQTVICQTNTGMPVAVAFDPDGTLFTIDQGKGCIYKFNRDNTWKVFGSGLKGPVGLTFDAHGTLFASSSGQRKIYQYTPEGVRTEFATNIRAYTLAFDRQGNLFVSTGEDGTLIKYSNKNGTLSNVPEMVADKLGHDYFMAISPKLQPYAKVGGYNVVGHIKRGTGLADDLPLAQGNIILRPDLAPPPVPKDLTGSDKIQQWYADWMKTIEGKTYATAQRRMARLQVAADGTVSGESVAPGKYVLSGSFWGSGTVVAEIESHSVVIPEPCTNDSAAPFDLGEINLKPVKHLNTGDAAPEFSVKTLADEPLKLSDYRGKYVLLDFWATWCGPCVGETPFMKATFDAYGKDARFMMISLSLDQSTDQPKQFALTHDIKWVQGYLGDWSKDTVTKDYNVRGIPSIFLIGPDGKIITQNLRGEAIKTAVGAALGR